MRTTIDPGIDRPTIFLLDHIVYSHVQNLGGQPLDLDLSLMLPLQNNGEMRRIFGNNQPEERPDATTAPQAAKPAAPKRPVILWFNGNGFRGHRQELPGGGSRVPGRSRVRRGFRAGAQQRTGASAGTAHRCQDRDPLSAGKCRQVQSGTRSASAWPGAVQAA